jgi:hypothetical protein
MSSTKTFASTARHPRRAGAGRSCELISWSRSAGIRVASIDSEPVGFVERRGLTYRVTNWLGEPVGAFLTLGRAKASLQPSRQAAMRDEIYHDSVQHQVRVSATVALCVVSVGAVAGTFLLQAPL